MRAILAFALLATGCGDNSKACGEGTQDRNNDGFCEPEDVPMVVCGPGTTLDVTTSTCEPDPAICADGQELVNGACIAPVVQVDLVEGPEPNGLAPSDVPAGLIAIESETQMTTLRGCLAPVDGIADFDVYRIVVAGPTLLAITLTGLEGPAPGYLARDIDVADLPLGFERIGATLADVEATRELFLPAAGSYALGITDGRTLAGVARGVAIDPTDAGCYLAAIAVRERPMPTTIAVPSVTTDELVGGVDEYAIEPGATVDIQLVMTGPDSEAAMVVYVDDELVDAANNRVQLTGLPQDASVGVIVDTRYDLGLGPLAYRLTVNP
jgi:hypothetical protein